MTCDIHAAGSIELYFYGELTPAERTTVAAHLEQCVECRSALEDLTVIRAALACRPDVATPPGADWSGFMHRLDQAIEAEGGDPRRAESERGRVSTMPLRRRLAPYLAIAAVLALITLSIVLVFRGRLQNVPDTA